MSSFSGFFALQHFRFRLEPKCALQMAPLQQGFDPDPSTHRPFRQAQGPSIFLGVLRSGVSLSNPEALEGQAQGHSELSGTMRPRPELAEGLS